MLHATHAAGVRLTGYSVMTGWGAGLQSLPAHAAAAEGCRVVPIAVAASSDERLRRATRECVLAVSVAEQACASSTFPLGDLAGPRTALVYASASAYAAANWAFLIDDKDSSLFFPYTAPSAVPGEVTIQFGITGPYLSLLSGANAGIEALWQAAVLLTNGQCDRALVLGVETFNDCEDLYASGRWLLRWPLVEAAVCLVLERHTCGTEVGYGAGAGHGLAILEGVLGSQEPAAIQLCLPTAKEDAKMVPQLQARWPGVGVSVVAERLGNCLACTTLIGLLLALAEGRPGHVSLLSRWWDAWSVLSWPRAC
jgi:Beta-ketoacyl synthase, N-terminal domain